MKITRRGFVNTVGLGAAAGILSGNALFSRPVFAQTREAAKSGIYDGGIMQLNQNESARGPGAKTLEAIRTHTNLRIGRGYSPDHVNELRQEIARVSGVSTDQVLLATGSSPILRGSVRAFCSPEKPLVTAGPTYSTSESTARTIGAPIEVVSVDKTMGLDLDAMASASKGAGLVYICNPNNPTGTVHSASDIEKFVRRVMQESPETVIHIDEAYIYYADPASMETALPLALEFENVFISRSFSKAHGLAGLRIGYAYGQEATLSKIDDAWGMGDVNMLAAIAALTALTDKEHLDWERKENADIRTFTVAAFQDMGYEVPASQTNHIFPNLGMPASRFRDRCLEHKIQVGRDFTPYENTHSRISLGTREEMQVAVDVFRKVLTG